jgi:hypothetical protein
LTRLTPNEELLELGYVDVLVRTTRVLE